MSSTRTETSLSQSGNRAAGGMADTPGESRGVSGFRRTILSAVARVLNPLLRGVAGSRLPLFAVVVHRGRRSGRAYATPVAARPTADGFVIPLTFGEQADWFRNVRAAGGCVVRWKGVDYPVVAPEVIDMATARAAFRPVERAMLPVIGITQFARLRHAPVGGTSPESRAEP